MDTENNSDAHLTAEDSAKRMMFSRLKYEIGNIVNEKFLEYNDGKFHTGIELNPLTHAITEFVFEKLSELQRLKEENERLQKTVDKLKNDLVVADKKYYDLSRDHYGQF